MSKHHNTVSSFSKLQNAKALGKLLSDFTSITQVIPESELGWSSASLASDMIQAAEWTSEGITESEAIDLLTATVYQNLKEKRYFRLFRGHIILTTRLFNQSELPERASKALLELSKKVRDEYRRDLFLPKDTAIRLVAKHRTRYPNTPIDNILFGEFKTSSYKSEKRLILPLYGRRSSDNWFLEIFDIAIAKLVHAKMSDADINEKSLFDLLEKSKYSVLNSLGYLSQNHLDSLSRTSINILEQDPSTGDIDYELSSPIFFNVPKGSPPEFLSTPYSLYQYFTNTDRCTDGYFDDGTRPHLGPLLSIILSSTQYSTKHLKLLFSLINSFENKPFLLSLLYQQLSFSHKSLIPCLLLNINFAPFAIKYILDISYHNLGYSSGTIEDRYREQHKIRILCLEKALPILTKILSNSFAHSPKQPEQISESVLDILHLAAVKSLKHAHQRDESEHLLYEQSEYEFNMIVEALENTSIPQVLLKNEEKYDVKLLEFIAKELSEKLKYRFSKSENIECIKVGTIMLSSILKTVFQNNLSKEYKHPISTLLGVIADRYAKFLQMDNILQNGYYGDPTALHDIQIEDVLLSETISGEQAFLSSTTDSLIESNSLLSPDVDDTTGLINITGVVERIRVHLRVLCIAYTRVYDSYGIQETTQKEILNILTTSISKILNLKTDKTKGSLNPFDREYHFPGTMRNTIKVVTDVLKVMPIQVARRILSEWINGTNDRYILLSIEYFLSDESLKVLLQNKFSSIQVTDSDFEECYIPELEEQVQNAALANHQELVNKLISYGNSKISGELQRPGWDLIVFRARLLLSYHLGNEKEIETLPIPNFYSNKQLQKQAEESRAFYTALVKMNSEPEESISIFTYLYKANPDSSTIRSNLFAAMLGASSRITGDNDKQIASFLQDLYWWRSVHNLPADYGKRTDIDVQNELYALDGAKLEKEFDSIITLLPRTLKYNPRIYEVVKSNFSSREQESRLEQFKIKYATYHAEGYLGGSSTSKIGTHTELTTIELIRKYRMDFRNIITLHPLLITKVLGRDETTELADFILDLHIDSAMEMLERMGNIAALRDEDKVNDFMVSSLRGRLYHLKWSVLDQTRGALSETAFLRQQSSLKGGIGERDWIIKQNSTALCLCEAMRLESLEKGKINTHISKVIDAYNSQGTENTIIIIYYQGKSFNKFSTKYYNHIENWSNKKWNITGATTLFDNSNLSKKIVTYRSRALWKGNYEINLDHLLIDVTQLNALREIYNTQPNEH